MKKPLLRDATANFFIKGTGIPRRTFYNRVVQTNVSYIQPYRGERYYSVKSWLEKNPDYPFKEDVDNVA